MRVETLEHQCTVRGVAAASLFSFLRRELGAARLEEVVAGIEAADRHSTVRQTLMSERADEGGVLPVRTVVDLLTRAGELHFASAGGPAALAERVGVFAAREDQPLMKQMGVDVQNPEQLVRSAPRVWRNYSSCGSLVPTRLGLRTFSLTLDGLHDVTSLWCRCLTGYFRELLGRACGCEARVLKVRCVADGASACEWQGDWNSSTVF